jgi:hypothetical protein
MYRMRRRMCMSVTHRSRPAMCVRAGALHVGHAPKQAGHACACGRAAHRSRAEAGRPCVCVQARCTSATRVTSGNLRASSITDATCFPGYRVYKPTTLGTVLTVQYCTVLHHIHQAVPLCPYLTGSYKSSVKRVLTIDSQHPLDRAYESYVRMWPCNSYGGVKTLSKLCQNVKQGYNSYRLSMIPKL